MSAFLAAVLLAVVSACGTDRIEASTGGETAGGGTASGAQRPAPPAAVPKRAEPQGGARAGAARKYHPGHYVDLLRYQVLSDAGRFLIPSLKPGVAGVQTRYLWRDLEPRPGEYDFSRIESDLKVLADKHKQLIVVVADKSFKSELPVPDYLAGHALPNRKGGYTVRRWDRYVVERWVRLVQALGARFDANPNFEGVGTEESSPSLDDERLKANGYTADAYRDALIEMLQRTAEALPRSRVFWYMNFMPGNQKYIAQVAAAVAPYGVAMGGPDVLPDNPPIKRLAYPFYDRFQGRMPLFCVVMPNSYRHRHKGKAATKYWTMDELYAFARDELHLNYMLWTYVAEPSPGDAYDITDAFPVMQNHPLINAGDFGTAGNP